uniref:HTH CENPB-type domain-containing protein n=1 Tax=Globisporangium ultimum (strain ATCC 200006 / CBS 805.95 / DAOM BR144) TaxID=431595 RepID=K3X9K8_GLOUD
MPSSERIVLTDGQRQQIAAKAAEQGQQWTNEQLSVWAAEAFRLDRPLHRTTISKILKRKDEFKGLTSAQMNQKRRRAVANREFDDALAAKVRRFREYRAPLTDSGIVQLGVETYDEMRVPEEQRVSLSTGWLSKFKARHGLGGKARQTLTSGMEHVVCTHGQQQQQNVNAPHIVHADGQRQQVMVMAKASRKCRADRRRRKVAKPPNVERIVLTDGQRQQIAAKAEEEGQQWTNEQLSIWAAETFKLDRPLHRTTISKILKRKDEFESLTSAQMSQKRRRGVGNSEFEDALVTKVRRHQECRMPLSDNAIVDLAVETYEELHVPEENRCALSSGWRSKFKARHGLKFSRERGETAAAKRRKPH